MRSCECKRRAFRLSRHCPDLLVLALLASGGRAVIAQAQDSQAMAQQIQNLKSAMANTQAQLEQSQRQLEEMKQQLNSLELKVSQADGSASTSPVRDTVTDSASTQQEP